MPFISHILSYLAVVSLMLGFIYAQNAVAYIALKEINAM